MVSERGWSFYLEDSGSPAVFAPSHGSGVDMWVCRETSQHQFPHKIPITAEPDGPGEPHVYLAFTVVFLVMINQ